jgi:hypothetical protein
MIHHDVAQNSEEWHRLRLGIPTASEFKRIVTPKGKLSAQSDGYMHRLLAEWAMGAPLIEEETQWMTRGTMMEPQAVAAYEFDTGRNAELAGFFTTDDGLVGCSPDRLIGDDGLLEIKCPSPQVHIGYMLQSDLKDEYWPQVQGQLWVTGRAWLDIQSYCPGLPNFITRVERDEKYIALLEMALKEFTDRMLDCRKILEDKGLRRGDIPTEPANEIDDSYFDVTDADVDAMLKGDR